MTSPGGDNIFRSDEHIRRDHTISHVLAALSAMQESDDLIFFGGTALSHTYLTTLRLSEDIDLITTGDRAGTGDRSRGGRVRPV